MIDPTLLAGLAAGAGGLLLWARGRRPAAPAPEPPSEVWVRRTTTVEEFRATGPGREAAVHVFDPQYQTLRPQLPMLGR